jgi:hypothetical protein
MQRRKFIQIGTAATLAGMVAPGSSFAAGIRPSKVFEPEPFDGILVNPGMGFETFNCFNGDEKDAAVRNYPECSISYHRYYWDRLEPEEGKYNFELLDGIMEKCAKHHQDLAMRFMPISPRTSPGIPAWYMKKAKGYAFDRNGTKGWSPDWNDPFFLDKWEALNAAFAERYNGHRHMDRMEIGGYGFWSEWHISHTEVPEITEENAIRLIDMHFRYWDRTPLMMLIGYVPGLRHAVGRGAGWRADSLGDWGHFSKTWNHMQNSYPQRLDAAPEAKEAWKKGPVAFEPPGRMNDLERYVPTVGGGYDNMWDKALEWGGSAYNAKSGDIPDAQVPSMERFLKKCGYRYTVKKVGMSGSYSGKTGSPVPLTVEIENQGVAPVYRDHYLALRLQGAGGEQVIHYKQVLLKTVLPGVHRIDLEVAPGQVEKGTYQMSLGILNEWSDSSTSISLANKGCDNDGWLSLEGIMMEVL